MYESYRFNGFTEHARKIVDLAEAEARSFRHSYIGTEHLLLGLMQEGESIAAKILAQLGADLDRVRSSVELIMDRGVRPVTGVIRLSPRLKQIFKFAADEAHGLNHPAVGTEHLLLGLMSEKECIGAGVIKSLGVDLEQVRSELTLQMLKQSGQEET